MKATIKWLYHWLWEKEWYFPEARFRKIATCIAIGSAVFVPLGLVTSFHLLDYLGPGLGDDTGYAYITLTINSLLQPGHQTTLILFCLALISILFYRGYFIWLAYRDYAENNQRYPNQLNRKNKSTNQNEKFPIDTFFLFVLYNLSMLIGITFIFCLLGLTAWLTGFGFVEGYELIKSIVHYADQLAHNHVPTLIDLPPFLAVIAIYTLAGFFHYWLHRLAHEFRFLWLLLHRPHHMPTTLMEPLTTGVVVAFPIGFIIMFPYILFFGACSKLFSSEPLYFEILVFNIIINIPNISAHSTSLYHMGFKHRWIGFLGHLFGSAQYHYLHHASQPVYSQKNTNLVNIGAGPYMMWDKLFNTFVEPPISRPNIGLTDQPELYKNPVRLLFAGINQIIYELIQNKSWKVRWKILTGTSDYTPPISQDFAIKKLPITSL